MKIFELVQPKKSLVIFDIDDTLMHTTAQISVIKDGKTIRKLTNQQFNNYELQPGEQFDFGEFRSAEKFNRESQPIEPMVRKLKTILAQAGNNEVIMLTARSDFDNKDLFLKTFTDLGIDMSRVHVYRAGNLPGDEIPAEKKAVIVRQYADTGDYDFISLYDDSSSNLRVFKSLNNEYPDIDFRAYYVGAGGTTQAVRESIDINQHKANFMDMFKKFLPIAMSYLKLDSLPEMKFEAHIQDSVQPTFGQYENGNHVLYVALMDRHPNDILRTVAHELVHYKQDMQHELEPDSGATGSPAENEANQSAGIIMRHFNKQYPEFLSSKPITENMDHNKDGAAVPQLHAALIAQKKKIMSVKDDKDAVYDIIDGMMTSIAKAHSISGQKLHDMWVSKYKEIPDTWIMHQSIDENFANGVVQGKSRPGRVKRAGASCKGSATDLKQKAKAASGERKRMYQWCANMKSGHKK